MPVGQPEGCSAIASCVALQPRDLWSMNCASIWMHQMRACLGGVDAVDQLRAVDPDLGEARGQARRAGAAGGAQVAGHGRAQEALRAHRHAAHLRAGGGRLKQDESCDPAAQQALGMAGRGSGSEQAQRRIRGRVRSRSGFCTVKPWHYPFLPDGRCRSDMRAGECSLLSSYVAGGSA